MPKSTEVQRHYLKITDQLVKSAIAHPRSFKKINQLNPIQIEAIESGIQDVLTIIVKIQNLTVNLNSEEKNLCLDVVTTLIENKNSDFPLAWQVFFGENPERGEELYSIIEEMRDLMMQLVENHIDINEYAALINDIAKSRFGA